MIYNTMSMVTSSPINTILTFGIFVAIGLSFWAQFSVGAKIKKYSSVPTTKNGLMVAQQMLEDHNIYNVKIKIKNDNIGSEYYDPMKKCVVLSEQCAHEYSISAISVAAHEVGHAIQHNYNNPWSVLRMKLARPVSFISTTALVILMIGSTFTVFMGFSPIIVVAGIVGFGLSFIFQLITLPVEFDASNRALTYLHQNQIVNNDQTKECKIVLKAAALTYIAATLLSLIQLLRFIMIFLNNRD